MASLVIVESPAKAKTIEKYLGDGYTVKASVGHVRDLPKSNKNAIDIEAGFVPHYQIVEKKEKVITELRQIAKKMDNVILATDPDREGEAIAWHVAEVLKLKKPKRIVFNEITEDAVKDALKHARGIDENMLKAQEARRVLDRLVGYDLSGLIWKKVRYGLSAGRVQSPALRILMEKEREVRAFIPEDYWVITADLKTKSKDKITFTCTEEPRDKKLVDTILKAGKKESWSVVNVKETDAQRKPRAPFTTSTLQQTASSRLGFAPSRTMRIAQKLYEAGHITYMRTDSTSLAKQAQNQILKTVEKKYGKEYVNAVAYKSRSKNAQEAHEAVRPTDFAKGNAGTTDEQKRLYRLIWARTVASQMTPAKTLRTKILAQVGDKDPKESGIPHFAVNGSQLIFPGWLEADPGARGEDVELPKVTAGDPLTLVSIQSEDKQTLPPPRYTEAGLVKELEKRGIGRPSTYASIIKTLQDRGYVDKEGKTLIPTDTGDVVSSFLEENFTKYISDSFTSEMEDDLDEIARGEREYVKTLSEFYTPFTKDIAKKAKDAKKITDLGPAPEEFPCPVCKKPMVIKLSKNGKFMSCSNFPDCTGARTIEGEELEGPKETGEDCPECTKGKLIERDGRFGRFIACDRYPKCKYIKQDPELQKKQSTGVACLECKEAKRDEGMIVEKRGRFGPFFACSNYPKCTYAMKAKPTGNLCSMCGKLMMEGTKTIPERCSDKMCPMHNPHKLDKKKK